MQQLDYKKKNQYSILTIPVCDATTADNIGGNPSGGSGSKIVIITSI
jgi:hypothetical protein